MSVSYDGVLTAVADSLLPCCRSMDREVLRGRITAKNGSIMLASSGELPECRIWYCPFCGAEDRTASAMSEMKP